MAGIKEFTTQTDWEAHWKQREAERDEEGLVIAARMMASLQTIADGINERSGRKLVVKQHGRGWNARFTAELADAQKPGSLWGGPKTYKTFRDLMQAVALGTRL